MTTRTRFPEQDLTVTVRPMPNIDEAVWGPQTLDEAHQVPHTNKLQVSKQQAPDIPMPVKDHIKIDVEASGATGVHKEAEEEPWWINLKPVDGNGLALMCFAFSTFMFFGFLCNLADASGDNNGVFYLGDMLAWGVCCGLMIAGVFQGFQGDSLGFTSYVMHAAVLGTIGYGFKMSVELGANAGPFHILGFLCYATVWFDAVLAVLAFRAAKMFGVLYVSVAVMFFFIGANFQKVMSDSKDPTDRTGDYVAGVSCLFVSLQCCYLLIPVLTGRGVIV